VRIAELSQRSGVSTATIKYYLREGLLSPGVHTHPNQVDYDDDHVVRLRLIRALIDVGGLSISATGELLRVLDSAGLGAWEAVGKAQYALGNLRRARQDEPVDDNARAAVDALLARRGWEIHDESPARRTLVEVCATLRRLGYDDLVAALDDYATAIEPIAVIDINLIKDEKSIAAMTEKVIVATVLGDTLLSALRQLAQEQISRPVLSGRRTKRSDPAAKHATPVGNRPKHQEGHR
jgi:DNA-binding transcriptional MerR regulator